MRYDVLPGLPPYGPLPELFSETGSDTHREGFVVKFFPDASEAWVGNFQPGITSFRGAFPHPDKRHVVVVAGGPPMSSIPRRDGTSGSSPYRWNPA